MNEARRAALVVGDNSSLPKFRLSELLPNTLDVLPTAPPPIELMLMVTARSSSEYQKGFPPPPSPVPMLGFFSVGEAREREVRELLILMLEDTDNRLL